jgi:hypothetical protein
MHSSSWNSDGRLVRPLDDPAASLVGEGFNGAAASSVAGFGAGGGHRLSRSELYRRYEPRARLRSHRPGEAAEALGAPI